MENRIKTALEFLKNGQSFRVGELRLGAENPKTIEVAGWSKYTNFTNLTKHQCLRELEEIKALFYKMSTTFVELKDFIKDKSIEFNLYFDDYGKGSIWICSEKDKTLIWKSNIK